jgi:hypothetical protein
MSYVVLGENIAGLDCQSYKFMGKTLHFMFYELFNDTAVVPFAGTPSAEKIDFSNFALVLDFGTDSTGQRIISMKYKAAPDGSNQRKFIHAYEVGMMNPEGENGGMVANGDDSFKIHYLSHIGVECLLPNRLATLRAAN